MDFELSGKLPGKTKYSGRRRAATRRAGFSSHPDSTGGELKTVDQPTIRIKSGEVVVVDFSIPRHRVGQVVAFGGWYRATGSVTVSIDGSPYPKQTLVPPCAPNWSKFGAMWSSTDGEAFSVQARFLASKNTSIAFFELGCGVVSHKHLDNARTELLKNMYKFSPEAHFFSVDGEVAIDAPDYEKKSAKLYLKSCNRCARFLPINIDDELIHLSFSNHCKAEHRRPCSHPGFGKLKNIQTQRSVQLDYGYQLECRFCKKFEVNAPHNPQRTAAQMKEDGARRRALELLLTDLFGESPQLRYRHKTGGRELADDIWSKFEKRCFNCSQPLTSQKKMQLDHTRPLALLWPLDETATCLCKSCNSEKRDRSPATFYTKAGKLDALSKKTGIPLSELRKPSPNMAAIRRLQQRLNWFFEVFCLQPALIKERDGKVAVELLLKAIQKTLNKCPGGAPFNILEEYERRQP